jgi:thiamine-phosphate pyrophosphorylase
LRCGDPGGMGDAGRNVGEGDGLAAGSVMARCYSDADARLKRQPLPRNLAPVSDARNDAVLEAALKRLPRGSGLVFRHYHLPEARAPRALPRWPGSRGRAGTWWCWRAPCAQARAWGADGAYGPARLLARGGAGLRLVTVHSLGEMTRAPAPTRWCFRRSIPPARTPAARCWAPLRFKLAGARARRPVIALGGMDARRAARLGGGAGRRSTLFRGEAESLDFRGFLTRSRPRAHSARRIRGASWRHVRFQRERAVRGWTGARR